MARGRIVDVHAHILPQDTMELMRKEAPAIGPRLERIDDDFAVLDVAGSFLSPVPARRLGPAEAISRHGCSRHRHAGCLQHPADLPLQSGRSAHCGARRVAERSDRQGGCGPPRSTIGDCDTADAGARAGRRRAASRHAQAWPQGRADRLQRQWPQSRRPGARAAMGSGQRARRLHHGAPDPGRRSRPAEIVLSRQSDRQSAGHDHRGSRARVRRRDRALCRTSIS